MAGYFVIRSSEIVDQAAFDEYAKLWAPVAEKYGARFIAYSHRDLVIVEST